MRIRCFALHDLEEALLDSLGNGAAASSSNLDAIHGTDWGDLDRGAYEEHLISDVQNLARQGLFTHREAELTCDRNDRITGNAPQDRVPDWGGINDPFADDEDVLATAFAQITVRVERDSLRVSL